MAFQNVTRFLLVIRMISKTPYQEEINIITPTSYYEIVQTASNYLYELAAWRNILNDYTICGTPFR